jgi:hypothetical protein
VKAPSAKSIDEKVWLATERNETLKMDVDEFKENKAKVESTMSEITLVMRTFRYKLYLQKTDQRLTNEYFYPIKQI